MGPRRLRGRGACAGSARAGLGAVGGRAVEEVPDRLDDLVVRRVVGPAVYIVEVAAERAVRVAQVGDRVGDRLDLPRVGLVGQVAGIVPDVLCEVLPAAVDQVVQRPHLLRRDVHAGLDLIALVVVPDVGVVPRARVHQAVQFRGVPEGAFDRVVAQHVADRAQVVLGQHQVIGVRGRGRQLVEDGVRRAGAEHLLVRPRAGDLLAPGRGAPDRLGDVPEPPGTRRPGTRVRRVLRTRREERPADELRQVGGVGAFEHARQRAALVDLLEDVLRQVPAVHHEDVVRAQVGDRAGQVRVGQAGVGQPVALVRRDEVRPGVAELEDDRRPASARLVRAARQGVHRRRLDLRVEPVQAVDRHQVGVARLDRVDDRPQAVRLPGRETVSDHRVQFVVRQVWHVELEHRVVADGRGAVRGGLVLQVPHHGRLAGAAAGVDHPVGVAPAVRLEHDRVVGAGLVEEGAGGLGVAVEPLGAPDEHDPVRAARRPRPGLVPGQVGPLARRDEQLQPVPYLRRGDQVDAAVVTEAADRADQVGGRRLVPEVEGVVHVDGDAGQVPDVARHLRGHPRVPALGCSGHRLGLVPGGLRRPVRRGARVPGVAARVGPASGGRLTGRRRAR